MHHTKDIYLYGYIYTVYLTLYEHGIAGIQYQQQAATNLHMCPIVVK
jgi:hypothetical protein